jgi:hypothetical protein
MGGREAKREAWAIYPRDREAKREAWAGYPRDHVGVKRSKVSEKHDEE